MGACFQKEKQGENINSFRSNHDRIINCVIKNNEEQFRINLNSRTSVKEIKHFLMRKFDSNDNKFIKLYYQEKELEKEEELIGNICIGEQLQLVMVSFSITDSMHNNPKRIEENIINNLTSSCKFHNGEKELNICITCSVPFCNICSTEHKNHQIISKIDLLKYSEELKESKENIIKTFNNLELTDIYSDTDICKKYRSELNMNCDQLIEKVQRVKNISKTLYSDFKEDFDVIFPHLNEYKEKVESLYEDTKKETTVRFEKNFVNFYCQYRAVKNKSNLINDYIFNLKTKIENFKEVLIDFNMRLKKISEFINDEFNLIKDYNLSEEASLFLNQDFTNNLKMTQNFLINNSSNNFGAIDTKNDKKLNGEQRSSILSTNPNLGRLSLITLLSPPKHKKAFLKIIGQQKKDKKKYSDSINNIKALKGSRIIGQSSNIDEAMKELTESDNSDNDLFYNIEIQTSNLICYNSQTNKLSKINVDLSKVSIRKFEAFHSSLNYNGKFYVSGGCSPGKLFCRYSRKQNAFIKLENMPNKHCYHCLLGVENSIFSISGFKSKKVDRYNINIKSWVSMPELENSRSFPSCISVDNKYIFIFGGLWESQEGLNKKKLVEKLNITDNSPNNNWESIEIQSEFESFSFYFGVLKMNNEKLLLLGGKYDPKEDNINDCFSYTFENNTVALEEDIKLPYKDEFDGKLFLDLGNDQFGQFSAIHSDRFYIINPKEKEINVLTLE